MQLFIVISFYPYEGYSEPKAVFDTKEAAERFRSSLSKSVADHEIIEIELNQEEHNGI